MLKDNFFDSDMIAIKGGFENYPSLCRYLSRLREPFTPIAIANLPKMGSKNVAG